MHRNSEWAVGIKTGMHFLLYRRTAAARRFAYVCFDATLGQSLAQKHLHLRIGTSEIGRSRALDRGEQCRIETQRKRLFGRSGHDSLLIKCAGIDHRLSITLSAQDDHQV